MLKLIDLFVLEVVVASKLGVASSHRVGGFQQIASKETVARFDQLGILGFEFTGLVLDPDTAGELDNGGLGLKAVDVAYLSDDTGRVNFAYAGGVRVFGMISNCCSMALSKTLICFSRVRMVVIETDMAWFTESFTVLGRR